MAGKIVVAVLPAGGIAAGAAPVAPAAHTYSKCIEAR